jgi:hypothetical protein
MFLSISQETKKVHLIVKIFFFFLLNLTVYRVSRNLNFKSHSIGYIVNFIIFNLNHEMDQFQMKMIIFR